MGVFSEMAMDNMEASAAVNTLKDPVSAAEQRDNARQQAEEEQAKEILSQLQAADKEEADEDKRRREHEEAEAKRKAEWEARKKAKEEAEQAAWENAVAMSDEDVMSASMKRVGDDTERLTRRNMKQCVTEHIQTKCLESADFARQVMHPRKNMIHCFRYITRKAKEFAEREMKDNDEKPMNGGYGCDVPDDLCYQWAEDYFMDLDAPEDKEKEENFVPKPYYGGTKTRKKSEKKAAAKKETKAQQPAKAAEAHKKEASDGEQMTLLDMAKEAAT